MHKAPAELSLNLMDKYEGLSPLARRALAVQEQAGSLVDFMGVAPIPDKPVVSTFETGNDWIVIDAVRDPHVCEGTLAVPRVIQRKLGRIDRSGTKFERLFVAHELPRGSVEEITKSSGAVDIGKAKAAIGQPSTDPRVQTVAEGVAAVTKKMAKAALIATVATAVLPVSPLALAALASGSGLDPAILGVVSTTGKAETGELGVFFLLASWR